MSQQSYSKILLHAAAMMAGIVLSVCSAMAQNFVTGRVVDLTSISGCGPKFSKSLLPA